MKITRKISLGFIVATFLCCNATPHNQSGAEEKPKGTRVEAPTESGKENSSKIPKATAKTVVAITKLTGLPEYISGCSCYFSESVADFKNQKFVFAHNYEGLAVISLDNKPVKLQLVKTTRDFTAMINQAYQETYANETYTATISVIYKNKRGDETWWNEGELTLTKNGAAPVTRKLEGECGC